MKKFIAYYRVSTKEQGNSGLGLSAQREAVSRFINDKNLLVSEFQEVESGRKSNRPQLIEAIKKCKETNSTLIIAKLDRLSRNASFTLTLRDSGVDFVCADIPEANSLTIGLLSILAEEEANKISERTSSALSQIKKKLSNGEQHISKSGKVVTSLGNSKNLTHSAIERGREVRKRNAHENPESIKAGAFIIALHDQGFNFKEITDKLNSTGFKTPKGFDFNPAQTIRLFNRYKK